MRRFDSIVMQETEPVEEGALWLRQEHNNINNEEVVTPVGMNFWWFSEYGWRPLSEVYKYKTLFKYDATTSNPITIEESPIKELGIISVEKYYSMYDGTRNIGDNTNFVNEKALKKHVTQLQTQIDALKQRLDTLEPIVNNHTTTLSGHTTSISNLNSRVSVLENN